MPQRKFARIRGVWWHRVIAASTWEQRDGDGRRMHAQFDWTGTDDSSAWLTVPDALEAVATMHPDGWPGVLRSIRERCRRVGADGTCHMTAHFLGAAPHGQRPHPRATVRCGLPAQKQ